MALTILYCHPDPKSLVSLTPPPTCLVAMLGIEPRALLSYVLILQDSLVPSQHPLRFAFLASGSLGLT